MILLDLFLVFLEIGAVSFGGGYGMISLVREKMLLFGWMTEEELLQMIAIAESTPGPIAINMATYVGSTQGGILGSAVATLGVVLPAFLIILLIASVIRNFLQYRAVGAFLGGVRPVVVALIMTTALTMLTGNLLSFRSFGDQIAVDFVGCGILLLLVGADLIHRRIKGKKIAPIHLILISAVLGIAASLLFP